MVIGSHTALTAPARAGTGPPSGLQQSSAVVGCMSHSCCNSCACAAGAHGALPGRAFGAAAREHVPPDARAHAVGRAVGHHAAAVARERDGVRRAAPPLASGLHRALSAYVYRTIIPIMSTALLIPYVCGSSLMLSCGAYSSYTIAGIQIVYLRVYSIGLFQLDMCIVLCS